MENKIYTEKTRKLRQNTLKIADFLRYYGKIHLTILTILTIPTTKVEEENMDRPLQDLPQIQIPLTRPQDTGSLQKEKMTKNFEKENQKQP